ncbi:hypothetical protein [Flavisolibacter tropicus]|uniref:Cytochrome b561 bacterial/Ni-hydrogenase domain-containing protein n=1 Tax=Flavisolibacter tropicus TaxID=1492898 RepID=A0A172TTE6_9BACT|nr:hypothetical protein [Flavisolibacter tropicus]ANE50300.1 hypothetical protein SY85_07080 [Flavisolibacter tropicus]
MYTGLLHLHSFGRWIVLILLLVAIFKSATAGNRPFEKSDRTVGLLLTIFADIMLLVGIALWFMGAWGYQNISNRGMGEVMGDPVSRFFAVEHTIGMLVAIVLLHIGKAQSKKSIPDSAKHKRTFIFYLIALLIVLASIPWPIREIGAGRGWF